MVAGIDVGSRKERVDHSFFGDSLAEHILPGHSLEEVGVDHRFRFAFPVGLQAE